MPASPAVNTLAKDPVKQFSVFMENRVGRLSQLISLLGHQNIHVMAITVLDTTDSTIIRLVVDDPEKTATLFEDQRFPFTTCQIVAVEINNEGQLKFVLAALLEAEINIHYIYPFIYRPEGKSALAMHVEDVEVAVQALGKRGFKVLTQADISR
ncbi:MAG: acetolactate synthase [Puniceicoccaceae bacterium]|nr:MAG: acetolactate synthase [Puniceicoccaceae bacterium]